MVKELTVGRVEQLTNDAIDVITEKAKAVRCVCDDTSLCGHHLLIAERQFRREPPNEDVKRLIISLLRTLKRTYPKNFREVLQSLVVK